MEHYPNPWCYAPYIPLVKDNLGDMTSSDNYRAIAGSCLLLKLLDQVMISMESDKLSFSELQFAY